MLRLDKVIKPWKESAALNDHINLYGFWNETAYVAGWARLLTPRFKPILPLAWPQGNSKSLNDLKVFRGANSRQRKPSKPNMRFSAGCGRV